VKILVNKRLKNELVNEEESDTFDIEDAPESMLEEENVGGEPRKIRPMVRIVMDSRRMVDRTCRRRIGGCSLGALDIFQDQSIYSTIVKASKKPKNIFWWEKVQDVQKQLLSAASVDDMKEIFLNATAASDANVTAVEGTEDVDDAAFGKVAKS
jgi:hypothetical protein